MIFDRSDREALFRTEVRKACESAMVNTREDISPTRRQIISQQLMMDVNRCHAMVRIADNDLSSIREDAAMMDSEPIHLPLDLYDDYISVMKEEDRESEAYYTFLYTYMLGYLEHIRGGIRIADVIIEGGNPVSEKDMLNFVKVRSIMDSLQQRCSDLMDVDSDVPYGEAMEFIDCNLEECSIMLRIGSGRDIPLDEMSLHLEWSETVDDGAFDSLFLRDMSPSDRRIIDEYLKTWDVRVRTIIGRCIADTELGSPSTS